jgi:hypothetical protein
MPPICSPPRAAVGVCLDCGPTAQSDGEFGSVGALASGLSREDLLRLVDLLHRRSCTCVGMFARARWRAAAECPLQAAPSGSHETLNLRM